MESVLQPRKRGLMIAATVGLLLGGTLVGSTLWSHAAPTSATPVTHFRIDLKGDLNLSADAIGGCIALSPNGRSLVYAASDSGGASRLYLRRMDAIDAVPLPGTGNALTPCFSPDGDWIAFYDPVSRELRKIRIDDPSPTTIAAVESSGYGLSWGADGNIYFASSEVSTVGMQRIASNGGAITGVTAFEGGRNELSHTQPEVLPDGSAVLFTCARTMSDQYRTSIDAVRIGSGERRVVVNDACQPRYLSSGHLVYFQGGSLMAAAFDPRALTFIGEPRRVLDQIAGAELIPRERFTLSRNGTLAFLPSATTYECRDLAWFNPDGSVASVYQGGGPAGVIASVRLSPDGRFVAFAANSPTSPDIWVLDLTRKTTTRITSDGGHWSYPVWTPDGKKLAFSSSGADGRNRIDWAPADGTSPPQVFAQLPPGSKADPCSFSPDGKTIFFSLEQGPGTLTDLFRIEVEGDHALHPVFGATTSAYRPGCRLSPDGSLIAYTSQETGRLEIYLQTYPALDKKVRVSVAGGLRPAWSADGKRLFFQYQDRIFEATIIQQPELSASAPRQLLGALPDSRYDAAPDGTRFILGVPPGGSVPQTQVDVVEGWGTQVRRTFESRGVGGR